MGTKRVVLLFFTLINLRFEQFYYRFYYRFFKFRVRSIALKNLDCVSFDTPTFKWIGPSYLSLAHFEKGVFKFLGEMGKVSAAEDWNSPKKSKLWLYNLHYFDDLGSDVLNLNSDLHSWLVERWIKDNPPLFGMGGSHILRR